MLLLSIALHSPANPIISGIVDSWNNNSLLFILKTRRPICGKSPDTASIIPPHFSIGLSPLFEILFDPPDFPLLRDLLGIQVDNYPACLAAVNTIASGIISVPCLLPISW